MGDKMKEHEKGEIMLEGMIITILTTFLLIWILAVGFIYYQSYLVTTITNDAAVKIAATYNNPDSDLIMGYISSEDLSERDLYRGFDNNALFRVNQNKVEAYVSYKLKQTNFAGTIDKVDVKLELVKDSSVRKHVEVSTECTFNTPFGSALELFGMDEQTTYTAIGRADCTDFIDYISTVDFAAYQLGEVSKKSEIVKMVNSLIKIFNHDYS